MEIREIVKIQKECRKEANELAREAYGLYDAIWTDRIRITPELEAVVGELNRKMPNLLVVNHNAPSADELARKYGFAGSQALLDYLLGYEPRGKKAEGIYRSLLEQRLSGSSIREREIALTMSPSEIMRSIREAVEMAREITAGAYEKYDEIWSAKIRITPELLKHGQEVVNEINRKMPNLLTHDPMRSALDQVAQINDFESSQDLVDWLLAYTPRSAYQERVADQILTETLGLTEPELDEVPF